MAPPRPWHQTRHRQSANIQKRRYWSAQRQRFVRLTVSTSGIRVINRRGVDPVLRDLESRGIKL